jgi:hypothetical protein
MGSLSSLEESLKDLSRNLVEGGSGLVCCIQPQNLVCPLVRDVHEFEAKQLGLFDGRPLPVLSVDEFSSIDCQMEVQFLGLEFLVATVSELLALDHVQHFIRPTMPVLICVEILVPPQPDLLDVVGGLLEGRATGFFPPSHGFIPHAEGRSASVIFVSFMHLCMTAAEHLRDAFRQGIIQFSPTQ